jgi:hypothetical protein
MRCLWRGGVAALVGFVPPCGCEPALAGAWSIGEGRAIAIATASFSDSLMAFDAKGKLLPVSSYRKFNLGLYVEYGYDDRLTLIVKPTLADVVTAGPPAGRYRGLEALEAGARWEVAKFGDIVLSAQATGKLPGSMNAANPAVVGATARELDARLLAGYSFQMFKRDGFAEAQVGWRVRDGGNPGEARVDVTLGLRPYDRILALLQSFNVATTGSGTAAYPSQKYSKLQPSVVYELADGWSVQGGGFLTIAAVNARRDQGLIAAVWKRF